MSYYKNALKLKSSINTAAATLTDEVALEVSNLFPEWVTDTSYSVGNRVRFNEVLYKCAQAHISQDDWTPSAAPALWVAVSLDPGTADKPITAVRGMDYELDKLYLDPEDNKIYRCTRASVLHYLPHELVGHYFELAE